MKTKQTFISDLNLCINKYEGSVKLDSVFSGIKKQYKDEKYSQVTALIIDFRNSALQLNIEDFEIASSFSEHEKLTNNIKRIVLLADNPITIVFGKLLQSEIQSKLKKTVQLYSTLEASFGFLGLSMHGERINDRVNSL